MFSGIIERTGAVTSLQKQPGGLKLSVDMKEAARGLKTGHSVAIDGVCLTAAAITKTIVTFDVVRETLSKTNLGHLTLGMQVNLERSLSVGDRLEGHFVQGHVDTTAQVVETSKEFVLWIQIPSAIKELIVPRGSIAVNGVSLTIAEVRENAFKVALIPITLQKTNLGSLKAGSVVNIETDMFARHIVQWLKSHASWLPGSQAK